MTKFEKSIAAAFALVAVIFFAVSVNTPYTTIYEDIAPKVKGQTVKDISEYKGDSPLVGLEDMTGGDFDIDKKMLVVDLIKENGVLWIVGSSPISPGEGDVHIALYGPESPTGIYDLTTVVTPYDGELSGERWDRYTTRPTGWVALLTKRGSGLVAMGAAASCVVFWGLCIGREKVLGSVRKDASVQNQAL